MSRLNDELEFSPLYIKGTDALSLDDATCAQKLASLRQAFFVTWDNGLKLSAADAVVPSLKKQSGYLPVVAYLPPVCLSHLGDVSFCREYGIKYAYVGGGMANGIASVEMVAALAQAGMLGFFGTGGLSLERIEKAIIDLQKQCGDRPFGLNLLHNPHAPAVEAATVDLYLRLGVKMVEAAAYLDLTLPLVRYRVRGIHKDGSGNIVVPNKVMAKISRIELARKFLAPPPDKYLKVLLENGEISPEQADLARQIPMAGQITVEADSGGHTDKGAFITLLPTILALRDKMVSEYNYACPVHIGGGGGIATPQAAHGAFSMGAAYLVTGTINQASLESGTSDMVRQLLAQAEQPDVTMAPAADMFEMGVKLQVLKRGTFFPMRAQRLFDDYKTYGTVEALPPKEVAYLEKTIFGDSLASIWQQTADFWQKRDAGQLELAAKNGRHKFALMCRWYLGLSSRWAAMGQVDRQADFQIWCGPAIGSFNEWTRGTFLENWQERRVALLAKNILFGAALLERAAIMRAHNCQLPSKLIALAPRTLAELKELTGE